MESKYIAIIQASAEIFYDECIKEGMTMPFMGVENNKGQMVVIARPPFNTMLKDFCEGINKEMEKKLKAPPPPQDPQ